MKRKQHKFMERKVDGTNRREKAVLNFEEKAITIAILVAIVILAALLVQLALNPPSKEGFVAIYVLDSEKQTENFLKTVVLGENNTFTLWVGVENQNGTAKVFSVLVKLDNGTLPVDPSPVNATENFEKSLLDGEVWEFQVTISVEQVGMHRIIFELWSFDETENDLEYSGNWVSLSFEAIQE